MTYLGAMNETQEEALAELYADLREFRARVQHPEVCELVDIINLRLRSCLRPTRTLEVTPHEVQQPHETHQGEGPGKP